MNMLGEEEEKFNSARDEASARTANAGNSSGGNRSG
jgi:hypothetical protein